MRFVPHLFTPPYSELVLVALAVMLYSVLGQGSMLAFLVVDARDTELACGPWTGDQGGVL